MKHIACLAALLMAPLFQDPPKPEGAVNLVVHEWGVAACMAGAERHLIGANGPAKGDDPDFIGHVSNSLGTGGSPTVREPLIYFTVDKVTDFTCRVRFGKEGYPTCFYPPPDRWANTSDNKTPGDGFVEWSGKIDPQGCVLVPQVPAGHWVEKCRNVDSSPVIVKSRSEKFLFYEGVVALSCPVIVEEAGDAGVAVKGAEGWKSASMALRVEKGVAKTFDLAGTAKALSIEKMLLDAGLTRKEAAALLGIWQDHFMKRNGLRLLTLLTGGDYDRLLPIEITPTPVEIKRVMVLCIDFPSVEVRNRVDHLVKGLGAADIGKREQAANQIVALGPIATGAVAKYSTHVDPEVRLQVGEILERLRTIPVPVADRRERQEQFDAKNGIGQEK